MYHHDITVDHEVHCDKTYSSQFEGKMNELFKADVIS